MLKSGLNNPKNKVRNGMGMDEVYALLKSRKQWLSVTQIANILQLSKGTVLRNVDGLVKRELIKRKRIDKKNRHCNTYGVVDFD